jgi:hypothetical protein
VVGAGAELASVARSDIAFLLYAAGRVLDGARLYLDVVEINPPLIIALNLPAVLLARACRELLDEAQELGLELADVINVLRDSHAHANPK